MKNLMISIVLYIISAFLFSCQNSNEPAPLAGLGSQNAAQQQSLPTISTAMQVGNTILKQPPLPDGFEWKLVKTATLPINKGLYLTSPFSVVNEDAGDISWGSDGGCYQAIKTWKVTQANLKIVDVENVSPAYLQTLTFTQGQVNHAPAGSTSWTDYMPVGTVIAYKTSTGKYQLVAVKNVFPLVLNIYHENYFRVR